MSYIFIYHNINKILKINNLEYNLLFLLYSEIVIKILLKEYKNNINIMVLEIIIIIVSYNLKYAKIKIIEKFYKNDKLLL